MIEIVVYIDFQAAIACQLQMIVSCTTQSYKLKRLASLSGMNFLVVKWVLGTCPAILIITPHYPGVGQYLLQINYYWHYDLSGWFAECSNLKDHPFNFTTAARIHIQFQHPHSISFSEFLTATFCR